MSGGWIIPGGKPPDASRSPVGRTRGGERHPRPVYCHYGHGASRTVCSLALDVAVKTAGFTCDRGVLLHVMKKHGQYFTPGKIIKGIVDQLRPSGEDYAVDPGCGDGRFLEYLVEKGVTKIDGFDIDPEMVTAATRRVGEKARIAQRDVLKEGLPRKYDVIVANPPFSPPRPETAGQFTVGTVHPAAQFTELCIRSLTPRGRMAIILDAGLCTTKSHRQTRQRISELADIKMIFELRKSAFEKAAGTTFTTFLVFFRPRGTVSFPVFVSKDGSRTKSDEYKKELASGDWIPIFRKEGSRCESTLGDFMELVFEPFRGENDRCLTIQRNMRILVDDKQRHKTRRCVRNCLFLPRIVSTASWPRCALITEGFHGAGTTAEFYIIRPQKESDLAWLWYVINFSDEVKRYLKQAGRGQGRQRVSEEDLMALPLERPSDELVEYAELCLAKARLLSKTYEELRQNVMNESDCLDEP